ncbi:MAG: c-type cytochrome [Burkholderiaceae bacterium]|nr:c-type cytochrome [Burkholderiaceae bacterium]
MPDDGETDPVKLAQKKNCTACHALDKKLVGPAFRDIAARYRGNDAALDTLTLKTIRGGTGMWGQIPMPANSISESDARTIVTWILNQ